MNKIKIKDIKFKGKELDDIILHTMEKLSRIVGATLGPGGNVIVIERPDLPPLCTKDGVTVSKYVAFKDATEHVIAECAKEVCERTNTQAGDGTTTAIVLAEAIVRYGIEFLNNNPTYSPQQVIRELDQISEKIVIPYLKKSAKKVTMKQLKKVALISANFEEEVAEIVVEAIDKVGQDGTIVTEEGSGGHTTLEIKDGFPVSKGLNALGPIQSKFITNEGSQECIYDQPRVLFFDGDLNDFNLLIPAFTMLHGKSPLVIVAHKFDTTVLQFIAINRSSGTFHAVPLETQMQAGYNKQQFLHDLATYCNGKVFDGVGTPVTGVTEDDFGMVEKVKIGKYRSVFLGYCEEAEVKIQEKVQALKQQKEHAESEMDAEVIKERIGMLLGGIAVIYVGGNSELEQKEKRHRIEDAINATRSAIEMGTVPGGGTIWLPLANTLEHSGLHKSSIILQKALMVPFQKILQNSGLTEAQIKAIQWNTVMVMGSKNKKVPHWIYNALTHDYCDPYKTGIIDPVKVSISAYENALSVAKVMMTIGGSIVEPRASLDFTGAFPQTPPTALGE